MHPKVFVKLKKNIKTPSSGQKNKKKKPKNPTKTKKNHWARFFIKKNRVFSNPEIKWPGKQRTENIAQNSTRPFSPGSNPATDSTTTKIRYERVRSYSNLKQKSRMQKTFDGREMLEVKSQINNIYWFITLNMHLQLHSTAKKR